MPSLRVHFAAPVCGGLIGLPIAKRWIINASALSMNPSPLSSAAICWHGSGVSRSTAIFSAKMTSLDLGRPSLSKSPWLQFGLTHTRPVSVASLSSNAASGS